MKRKVIMRFAVAGASLLLTGAVAVSTVDKLWTEPLTVDSLGGLVEKYIKFRDQMGPIAPPSVIYQDVAERMLKGDWSFLKENWFFTFDDGVLYVPEKSALAKELKLPAQIQMREDLTTGQIYIFSAPLTDGKTGGFTGIAAFSAPAFMQYEKDFPLGRFLSDELSPRRVVWEVTLKSEADAWADLVFQSDEAAASELLEGGGMMRSMMVPEENINNLWLCLEPQSGSMNLNIFAPEGFTNRVEIYACTDLISNIWNIAVQELLPVSTNPATWAVSSPGTCGFFRCGNMDIDSDGDFLPDARESIVHKTLPNDPDTDGDSLSDYDEIHLYATDPLDDDSDDDGIPDGLDLSIAVFSPATNDWFGTNTVAVQGEVVFNTNGECRIWVNSLLVEVETNGAALVFSTNVLFAANGSYEVVVLATGFLGTNSIESTASVPIHIQAYPPDITILSPLDDTVVEERNVHVQVVSDSTNQIVIGGVAAARDGFIQTAWVPLVPGTNVIAAVSSDAFGRVGTDSITVVCDVPPGTPWEAVADQDMDGVLDENDPAPDNPGIRSNIYITEPENGGTTWLEFE